MTKSLTLRLPPELYFSSQQVAQERQMSLNALIQQSLAEFVRAERQRRLFDDFTLLGEDTEACDMEHALPAIREVVLAGEKEQAEIPA